LYALIQRLNREIKEDDLVLRKCSPYSKAYNSLGDYYVVDIHQNMIVERHLDSTDLQKLGKSEERLGRMGDYCRGSTRLVSGSVFHRLRGHKGTSGLLNLPSQEP
jgi:hypothetical protein